MTGRRRWPVDATGTVLLDSGAVSKLAENRGKAVSLVRELVERGWSLIVPMVVLVECLTGDARRDARTNRLLKAVDHFTGIEEDGARLAARLRHRSRNPSVVDALVCAEALGRSGLSIILTTDPDDLARHIGSASNVRVVAC